MESTDSSTTSSQQPQLPPGFRFHPTDEELVVHYLKKKASSAPLPVTIIAEVDLYKFDPWELPGKATFGEQEWYFFSPRDRKYPNGARPNRAATSGYWKATGTDKPILTSGGTQKVGVKKALVFYGGKPPKGIKTNWIMHEYRLTDNNIGNNNKKPPGVDIHNKKSSLRLDDWVLCRIYKKSNSNRPMEREKEDSMEDLFASLQQQQQQQNPPRPPPPSHHHHKSTTTFGALLENEGNLLEDILTEGGINNNSSMLQLASSSTPPAPITTIISLPLKRSLPPPYWNEVEATPASKIRFSSNSSGGTTGTGGSDGSSSQMATLLNQLPHAASSFHQQSLLGSLTDGVFRQPYQLSSMNWNS